MDFLKKIVMTNEFVDQELIADSLTEDSEPLEAKAP